MKKVLSIIISFIMFSICTFSNGKAVLASQATSKVTTYYVDSLNGNDNNNGTSVNKPWKSLDKVNKTEFESGDKILFKAGSIWNGQLRPHGSGSEGKPIIIDMYGIGNKPIINGQGIKDKEETEFGTHVSSALLLNDQQYWEINNLEITNNAAGDDYRRAVYVTTGNIGECKHIYFNNLYIHDVKSSFNAITWIGYFSGGIIFQVLGTGDPRNNVGNLKPTYFNDIKIENCRFENIDQEGIFIRNSIHMNRGAIQDGLLPWVPNKNVVVRNNSLNHVGGDGIVAAECENALIENNVAQNCHERTQGYYVAIWTINSDNTVIQNNEAYLTRTTLDGKAYDCDANCSGTTFQYNYSHDNEGGFMLICDFNRNVKGRFNEDSTIRYNISQNDKNIIFDYGAAKSFNTKIYNNTVYIGKDMTTTMFYAAHYSEVYNNIFYNLGSGGYVLQDSTYFDNNCYYGNKNSGQPVEAHGVYADPNLLSPGSGSNGRNSVDGYRLKANSPCINAGKFIADNGGKDYLGNPAPYADTAPDIGAVEYQGKGKPPVSMNNEFNWDKLGKGWNVIREDKDNWSLVNRPGYLTINTQPGDLSGNKNNLKNILVETAEDGDFIISTKLDFIPNEAGQNAGIIVYGDDDNYYTLSRDYFNGHAYIPRSESNGLVKMLGWESDSTNNAVTYLKIEKNKDTYTSYYSGDGINWIQISQNSGINIVNPKVGVFAGTTKTQNNSIKAGFDYIHYEQYNPNPAPIIDNFDSTYLDGRWDILKEDSSRWSLTERPGYLRIKAGPGSLSGIWTNNIRNIFVKSLPTQDFSIEAGLDFIPAVQGQQAGVLIYGDADNYISFTREITDARVFIVRSEINGVSNVVGYNDDVIGKSEVYYKIEKNGNDYCCYIRTDNSNWYLISKVSSTNIPNLKVGVFVTKTSADNQDINLDIDNFKYQPILK